MPPVQPSHYAGRKSSTGSTTSRPDLTYTESSATNTSGERRPSAGSTSYFSLPHSGRMNSDHGNIANLSSGNMVRSPYSDERERSQKPPNGRTHLDASAQMPAIPGSSRRKNNREGSDSNVLMSLSFLRTSRPPSPDPQEYSSSHTRKTSFSNNNNNNNNNGNANGSTSTFRSVVASSSVGSFLSSSSSMFNSSGGHSNNGGSHNGSSQSSFINNGNQYHHNVAGQSQTHPLDMESDRRRSNDSYSRSSSPDHTPEQQQQFINGAKKPSASRMRSHQRTDSIKNSADAQHRRSKSTDLGEMYGKRSGHDDPPAYVASPAKEAKKMFKGILRKLGGHQPQGSSSSLHQQHYLQQGHERSRKCSADDPYMLSIQSTSTLATIKTLLPDYDSISLHGSSERRHGNDGGDSSQRTRKGSKKDTLNQDIFPEFVVDYKDMGIKDDSQLPLISSAPGTEMWLPPESWGVQPPTLTTDGMQRSLTKAGDIGDDMDVSEFEKWGFGKKPLTLRIFREDSTYTTVNCDFNSTASELSANLGKKIFRPNSSKYHLFIIRNNTVRALSPHERPLNILLRLLLQFGYTGQDKLDELSGKDNSFICRFTFEENGAPLTTEANFLDSTNYAEVNLEKRCLPIIPIFLHKKAMHIVRLNVSHNQRMDLPLDFVQNCSVLRELRMAFNDLDRVPVNVKAITHLQVLDLRGNRIKSLETAQLEEAKELGILYLQSNRLDSIPDSFRSFVYLRILNLSSNRFTKVPMVLFEIDTLEELDMSFNDLSEIPDDIRRLTRLQKLLLFGNQIGPSLPKTMSDLNRLKKLDIRQNEVMNLDALNDMLRLEELLVNYNAKLVLNNSLSSLKVASFVKCNITDMNILGTGGTLTFLDMSSNELSKLEPAVFEHLVSLVTLKLDNNNISSLPENIGTLKHLEYLSISNNILSSLPKDIDQMESLVELDVHANRLSELPVAIWKCSLVILNASSNALESFPDPPKNVPPSSVNAGLAATSSSSITTPPETSTATPPAAAATVTSAIATNLPSSSRPSPLSAPTVTPQSTTSGRASYTPPLANSLLSLCLGDNRLPDEVMYPLSHLVKLQVLNLSYNYIAEILRGKIPNPGAIQELYLSGNQLTSLPAEDMGHLKSLRVLHVNGNKLTTLPAELSKIAPLEVLDVGCNMLKYNISNWPYDWNWRRNVKLKYLNMSGNKKFRIESMDAPTGDGNLTEFASLKRLRILGLMDVTFTDNIPENSVDRRVRTSMSALHNMSYGMADTLGRSDILRIWDLAHPRFQAKEDENLFGLFDGRSGRGRANCSMISHLKDRFGPSLKIELEKLEENDTIESALRRTFLGLDRELWPLTQDEGGEGGASGLVAYVKGMTLYCANVGDAIAVLVKKSDGFQVVSEKHISWSPAESARIKEAGGYVNGNGLLNDELDISRSFGHYNLVPIVNSSPYIKTTALTEDDDFLIMASSAFWDVMSHTRAVAIARTARRAYGDLMSVSQKLRDVAISYGAKDHMVVMLIGVEELFKKRELSEASDYHLQNYKRSKAPEGPTDASKYSKPEIEPPQGDVAMVFTDIKNSTKLWENVPIGMALAIKEHFRVMRNELRLIGGYEVKNEGDAMMASFSSVPAAMLWCLKVQELLVDADWPQEILDRPECRAIFNASNPNSPMYRGLSVRMGIHWGQPVSDLDAVTRRMDYYGPMVNRAARICDCADGGEICISSEVLNVIDRLPEFKSDNPDSTDSLDISDSESSEDSTDSPEASHIRELKAMGFKVIGIGEKKLKGLETPEILQLIYPLSLLGRHTMDPSKVTTDDSVLDLDSVRSLQQICLRLERLASGTTAQYGKASEQGLTLLSLPVQSNASQDDLLTIAENYIVRIENCISQMSMAKKEYFVNVFESLAKATGNDPAYILRALQMYVSVMGGQNPRNP